MAILMLLSRHRIKTKLLFRDGTSSEWQATPTGGAILQRTKGGWLNGAPSTKCEGH